MATILIVEDHAISRQMLGNLLGYKGHRVLEAIDGVSALELAHAERPDLIISDVVMPAMDGLELVRRLRADAVLEKTPAILYTAASLRSDAQLIEQECGNCEILSKPSEPEVILAAVERALGSSPLYGPHKPGAAEEPAPAEAAPANRRPVRGTELQLALLVELGFQNVKEREPTRLLTMFCQVVREVLGCRRALLAVSEGDGARVRFYSAEGELAAPEAWPVGSLPPPEVLERASSGAAARFEGPAGPGLVLPFATPSRAYGWLLLAEKRAAAPFIAEDEEVAGVVIAQTALAFENILLVGKLRRQTGELRLSEERLRLLVEGVKDYGIILLDAGGNIASWNTGAERVTGWRAAEVSGRHLSCLYPPTPDAAREAHAALESAAASGEYREVAERVRKDGSRFWAETTLTALRDPDGGLRGYAKVTHDITERRRAEQTLRESERRLREADRHKDEFLAVLSHELRNPLAPIRNSLFVLDHAVPGSDQMRRAHTVIDRQVGHLARLVDDLLDITRINRGKIPLRRARFELGELLRQTIEDHRSMFVAGGLELDSHVSSQPMWLDGDATRIAQVVGNLLGNAAKFTPRGGRVEITLDRSGGTAHVVVRDTGVGIAADVLEHVFQPFMQAAQTLERSRGGLGLGLALVKGIVELHGGTVSAASEGPGRGAELTVRLPLDPAPEGPATSAADTTASQRRRVLIIEDRVDTADTLKEALELMGHDVVVAYDGPSGIMAARELRPDVVLCDIGLPGMDGYEVASAFRADDELRSAVLVALTGYASPEDRQRAAEAGFTHHMAKPLSLEVLERVLAGA